MKKHSKRYRAEAEKVDASRRYPLDEAVALVREFGSTKFNPSVEVSVRLNIDPKKSDQIVRGSVSLPKGIGKERKVIVFAEGEEANLAEELGAQVGLEDLAEKIRGGWMDFDVAIAVPSAMKVVGKLGKILGPQGKMPSPKSGTVTNDLATAVKEFKAGKIEFRNDAAGNIQAAVGKVSFPPEDLRENVKAFLDHIRAIKPQAVKGQYMLGAYLSASMSPSVRLVVE
ncbi:MAG: 50S ribosomal protein L1 [Planctomycetota bacterium]|jgi:large subunit ribosomal protein L1